MEYMWTKEQQRESNRKWYRNHIEECSTYHRKWYESHRKSGKKLPPDRPEKPDGSTADPKAYYRARYLRLREQILAKQRTPEVRQRLRASYSEHRDSRLAQAKQYYADHKEERLAYAIQYSREHVVHLKRSAAKIVVAAKSPHPDDGCCAYCHRHHSTSLEWHHWSDDDPSDGLWLCSPCHHSVERMYRHTNDREAFILAFKASVPVGP